MNYYDYITSSNKNAILTDLCEYLVNKYTFVNTYSFNIDPRNITEYIKSQPIHFDTIRVYILSDNRIGFNIYNDNVNRDMMKGFINEVGCFLKYHKRKKVLNELL